MTTPDTRQSGTFSDESKELQIELGNKISETIGNRRPSFQKEISSGSYGWPVFTSIKDLYTPRDVTTQDMAEIILRSVYQIQQLLTSRSLIEELFKSHEAVCHMGLYRDPSFGYGGDNDPIWDRVDLLESYIYLQKRVQVRTYLTPFFRELRGVLGESGIRFKEHEFDDQGYLTYWSGDTYFPGQSFLRVEQAKSPPAERTWVNFEFATPE